MQVSNAIPRIIFSQFSTLKIVENCVENVDLLSIWSEFSTQHDGKRFIITKFSFSPVENYVKSVEKLYTVFQCSIYNSRQRIHGAGKPK